jgi:hypothetical protein
MHKIIKYLKKHRRFYEYHSILPNMSVPVFLSLKYLDYATDILVMCINFTEILNHEIRLQTVKRVCSNFDKVVWCIYFYSL